MYFNKNENVDNDGVGIYICDKNGKFYVKENEDNSCEKVIDLDCNDCKIMPDYYEGRLLYYKNNQYYLYDINDNKVIFSFETPKDDFQPLFYSDENGIYGFRYNNKKNNKIMFYNLKYDKTFEFPYQVFCLPKYDNLGNCKGVSSSTPVIFDDITLSYAPVWEGVNYYINMAAINLKTGDVIMDAKKRIYRYDNYFVASNEIFGGYSIYDLNGKILFDNSDKSTEYYYSSWVQPLNNDFIFLEKYDGYCIADYDGSCLDNSFINLMQLIEDMNVLENGEFSRLKLFDNSNIVLIGDRVYINFIYSFDDMIMSVSYKYDIEKRLLERLDENGFELKEY